MGAALSKIEPHGAPGCRKWREGAATIYHGAAGGAKGDTPWGANLRVSGHVEDWSRLS